MESPLPKSLPTPLRGAAPEPGLQQCSLFPRTVCFSSVLHSNSFQHGSIFFKTSSSEPVSNHNCNLFMFFLAASSWFSAEQAAGYLGQGCSPGTQLYPPRKALATKNTAAEQPHMLNLIQGIKATQMFNIGKGMPE